MGHQPADILVIEDAEEITALLSFALQAEGFRVRCEQDGFLGLTAVLKLPPDLLILDVSLPSLDGWQILERLKGRFANPIIMLTSQSDTSACLKGFRGGATDYVSKPFDLSVLIARIHAQLALKQPLETQILAHGDLVLDLDRHQAMFAGQTIPLTRREFAFLALLLAHPKQVVSRNRIIEAVWSGDSSDNGVEALVSRLRKKLSGTGGRDLVITHREIGYGLRAP